METDKEIDTVILACTHYPLLLPKIRQYLSNDKKIVCQGKIVADSLADYLRRHPEMDERLSRGGMTQYCTTENSARFSEMASVFLSQPIKAVTVKL